MEKIPEEITICYLQCVVMPNGEVISNGKSIGYFDEFNHFLTEIKKP